jgi:hypothetical protein
MSYIAAKSGMPGFACTASQIASSDSPISPAVPGRNQRSRTDGSQRLAFGERANSMASTPPEHCPAGVRDEIGDARVSHGQVHLQRFHRERQQRAGQDREREPVRTGALPRHQADEEPNGT